MRKLAYCLPVAALFMLAACNNELAEVQSPEAMGMDILTAGMPVTRTDLSAGESGVTVNWSKGDKLGVIFKDANENYTIVPYTLYKGEGTTNASFSGSKVPGATKICAYYPYNAADTYNATDKTVSTSLGSKLPMGGNIAENNQSQVSMKNAAGVIAIPLTLPEGDTYNVKLTSKVAGEGQAALAISGSATISFGDDAVTLAMEEAAGEEPAGGVTEQTVTVEGTGEAEYIYFPVAGTSEGESYTLELAVAEEGSSDAEVLVTVYNNKAVETGKSYDPVRDDGDVTAPIDEMSLKKVFTKGGTFKLAQNMVMKEITNETSENGKEVVIDLNGKKLTISCDTIKALQVAGKDVLTLKNGDFELSIGKEGDSNARIEVVDCGHLTLENVKATGSGFSFLRVQCPEAKLDILNSNIEFDGYFCMSTNASGSAGGATGLIYGGDATINLKGSVFKAEETAFMNNVPAKVTIEGCSFSGNHQAALMRGGKYTVSNSTFTLNAELESSNWENKRMSAWADGNRCAFAAITVGNYMNGSYQYPTELELNGCEVKVEGEHANDFPAMHVCANAEDGKGVTLTLGEGNTIANAGYGWPAEGDCIEYGTENIMVNGKAAEVSYKGMEQTANN